MSNEECAKAYGNIRPHKICAGIVGRDSCQGDSGKLIVEISKTVINYKIFLYRWSIGSQKFYCWSCFIRKWLWI